MANATPWVICDISPKLSEGFAKSLGGGECVKLKKFKFGLGWYNGNMDNPILQAPPLNDPATNDIPGAFYTGTFGTDALTVTGNKVVAKCHIPEGSVSKPEKVSVVGLYDQSNNLVAAAVFVPGYVVPDGGFGINCILEMEYVKGGVQ